MSSGEPKPPSVLGRAFKVLDAFPSDGDGITLTALAQRTGIPKGSLHRMLQQLVEFGALDRVDDAYFLGRHIFELAKVVPLQTQLREVALPFMIDLYERVHETIHLGVLLDTEVVYVERLRGLRQMRCPTRVGGRMPAYCTALGKSILAYSPTATVRRVVAAGLTPRTPHTVRLPGMFAQDLTRTRQRGIAVENEETVPGVACVGVPVMYDGRPIAAVSISGPSALVSIQRHGVVLAAAAAGISAHLGKTLGAMRTGTVSYLPADRDLQLVV